jgi:hypothetical protein
MWEFETGIDFCLPAQKFWSKILLTKLRSESNATGTKMSR